ncbi:hypothetical protein Ga0123462_2010 [Mariprofundus ferrinatatus]|uniref:Type II and III secretion system protein n=1 Tax=Mariprofundus ferrinatatus TaxID=1921087 RepID=A0A2K8L6D8_9PROT|nr:type II and III secretion system family protein [Mariprofundus ferrinatatus]ATX82847.1 hypothetical protein Ga0123462_2010 [Mariprofundus ferrinatatus]
MIRIALGLLMLCLTSMPVHAATETIEIYFLPLSEAADSARSQLSESGKVVQIPSRRLLIIEDDEEHLDKAKSLLQKLDQATPQFTAMVEMENITAIGSKRSSVSGHATSGALPGGWVQLTAGSGNQNSSHRQSYQLRISSARPGSIETGIIRSFNQQTQLWLSGYGVVKANSVEMVPVTSGFTVTASPAGSDQVRVRITPWMQRLDPQISGQHEMLIDLGTARNPATPPSANADMRLNAAPRLQQRPVIEITGAATELTVPFDQIVTIAASGNEAGRLGQALLGNISTTERREFVIRLRISR